MFELFNNFYVFVCNNYHYYSGVLIGLLINIDKMIISQIINFILISTMLVAGSKKILESFLFTEKDVLYVVIIIGIIGCKALRHFVDNYLTQIVDNICQGFIQIVKAIINKILVKIS